MRKLSFLLLTLAIAVLFTSFASATEEGVKWSPQYDDNGELLNPIPSVMPYGRPLVNYDNSNNNPVTASETFELFEDFETPDDWDGANPPTNWTVLDSGTFSGIWNTYDWYRYSYWGGYIARIYTSSSFENDDWLITPTFDLTSATACTLSFQHRYDDYSTTSDSALVLLSTDGGNNFTDTIAIFTDVDYGTYSVPDTQVIDISAYAAGQDSVAIAFLYVKHELVSAGSWYMDNVGLNADGANLMLEDFESSWGTYGDNPPTDWRILDFNPVDTWNNNDWHQYYSSSWGNYARVYNTPDEIQNEWLISPAMNFGAPTDYDQILFKFKHYYNNNESDEVDTAFVLLYDGTNWQEVAVYTSDQGSFSLPAYEEFDITSLANGYSDVKIAFKFVTDDDYYWYIDSVQVIGLDLATDDVATMAINLPTMAIEGYDWNVQTQVYNNGLVSATFQDSVYIERIQKTSYLYEDFNGDWGPWGDNPLPGWAILDYGDEDPPAWNENDWNRHSYWSGYVARVYDNPAENQDEWLISPPVNLIGVTENIYMTFHSYFNADDNTDSDTGFIYVSTDDFATYDTLALWVVDHTNENPVFDITSAAANQSNVKIAFRYVAYDALLWYVDDFEIYSIAYPPAVYVSGETITGLPSLEDTLIDFTTLWSNPGPDDYIVTSFTALPGDADNSNDTLMNQITCYPHFGSGGPDEAYYQWEDNITGSGSDFSWIDISSATAVNWDIGSDDDRYTSGIDMGFDFYFYGQLYDHIYLSENGLASFDSLTAANYYNRNIPYSGSPQNFIALLWDDLSGVTSGNAYYYTNNVDTFIVTYENWDFQTDLDQRIDMQMILCGSNNTIKCQYKEVGPVVYTSHTIGLENIDGYVGLEYEYNNDPVGNIAMNGLAITFFNNPPAYDAFVASVDAPILNNFYLVGETVEATVTVATLGLDSVQVPITLQYFDSGDNLLYSTTETTPYIQGQSSYQYTFTSNWLVDTESEIELVVSVSVPGDANIHNDTLATYFDTYQHYSEGGPDDYGYRFIDNINIGTVLDPPPAPIFNWIELVGDSLADSAGNGSAFLGEFPIGFDFDFYGTSYSTVFINGYGFLNFGDDFNTSTNSCPLPYSSSTYNDPTIAVFWDNGYTDATDGQVLYRTFGTEPDRYMVIQYYNYKVSSVYNQFEAILYENGNIVLQYLDVVENEGNAQGQSATIGIQSSNDYEPERSGLTYMCNASPGGNLLRDTTAVLFYTYQPLVDPIMHSIDAPVIAGVGATTYPTVTIENNGTTSMTMDVTVIIEDAEYDTAYNVTETTPVIDTGVTYQYTFTAPWTPSENGEYTIYAYVYDVNDEYTNNNDAMGSALVFDYTIDFETDNGGLIPTTDWEYGTPTNDGPETPHSGVNCWGTKLDGSTLSSYSVSDLYFEIRILDADPTFTFYQWYDGSYSIYCRVLIDSGSGYELFDEWRYSEENWLPYTVDLSAYSGIIKVDLQMETGYTSSSYEGWYVDDFGFNNCNIYFPEDEVELLSFNTTADILSGGESYDIYATVINNGADTATFDVNATDNYGFTQTQTVTDLPQFETAMVTFTGWSVMACSTHTLTVATALPDDEKPFNDSLNATYPVLPAFNKTIQYDDGTIVHTTRFVNPENVIANKFDVPYLGAELSAIGFMFEEDGDNDTINVFIFTDANDDGMPDTIPVYSDQIVTAGYGQTFWRVGCDNPITINCESFWAGWSLVDTVEEQNAAWMGIDDVNDYGMGWAMWRDTDTSAFSWQPWNSSNDGDNMIRAFYYGDESTAPTVQVDPTSATGNVDPLGSTSTGATLYNLTAIGCDLDYSTTVLQYVPGARLNSQIQREPIAWVASNDKYDYLEVTRNVTEYLDPVYPPVTLGSGGPDNFGYTWLDSNEPDGPVYGWLDISSTGAQINWDIATDSLDDNVSDPIPLGMAFNFYGVDYSEIYVSTNGWASFQSQSDAVYGDEYIPNDLDPNALLAVYWDDLEGQYPTGTYGSVYYYYDATENQFILTWANWHHYNDSETINFQIILDGDDNTVTYQYGAGLPHTTQTDYTIGIEGPNGLVGTNVANNQSYVTADLAVKFTPPTTWLTTDLTEGAVASGGSVPFTIYMDAAELECGTYNGAIVIATNDQDNPITQVDVTFTVGATITGIVTNASEAALEGVTVNLLQSETIIATTTTIEDGSYGFTCLNAGTYDVAFSIDDYLDDEVEVVVGAGATVTTDMVLHGPAHYSGIVSDEETNPLYGVHVYAVESPELLTASLPGMAKEAEVSAPITNSKNINDKAQAFTFIKNDTGELPVTLDVTLVADTYTDSSGAYELILEAGNYTIYYELEDYDAVVVDDTLEYDTDYTDKDITMLSSGYAYYPGDANMGAGLWPPAVVGGDVTYLVGLFRGLQPSCELDGFYAAGDANGSCAITGGDVTYLVNYFRGMNPKPQPCPDYPPLWLTPADFPAEAPDGWPNCDPTVVTGKLNPTNTNTTK